MSAPLPGPAGLLLIGPYPPPHGGISVHVAAIERLAGRTGFPCRVLDSGGHRRTGVGGESAPARADAASRPAATDDSTARSRLHLLAETRRLARRGWLVHVHVSGHAAKSWLLALACGLAGAGAPGRVLTVHSGIVPEYLDGLRGVAGAAVRALVRLALGRFERVICVSQAIRDAFAGLAGGRDGIEGRLAVAPAHLPEPAPEIQPPPELAERLAGRSPVLSTVLFFRPEYGLEVLLDALALLRGPHPRLTCLVMGGDDDEGAAEARRQIAARGLDGSVVLAGDLPHPLCRSLIARSDLFVRPTLADGDALSVREALALGVPVVASDAGHRPPGTVLFPLGDAAALARRIAGALDPAAAEERPHHAPHHAPSPAGAAERLLGLYRDAASAGPRHWEATCSPS